MLPANGCIWDFIPYGFQDASRRQGQQRGNLKDDGYTSNRRAFILSPLCLFVS
ncbi:hypothetical protein [Photorhabdus sp. RW14-46]|uniref:hypothetical protein n=1 Tax=Photorhabdus sp. RW14-46 TaxID=2100168 RepID=UPI001A98EB03|nr:hypothetical protein [Photorhabdus sp. RW14-46]